MSKRFNKEVWDKFVQFTVNNLDFVNETDLVDLFLNTEPNTSIRYNSKKAPSELFGSFNAIPWSKFGRMLPIRPVIALDPLFHAGAYYVQESHSMMIEKAIDLVSINDDGLVLDLCASPGGKSTHLLDLIPDDCLLVSNELNKSRNNILVENLSKWGRINVIVTQNDPSHFSVFEGLFDLVLVDAPCSGEGLFRKDQEALNEWSEENVFMCQHRQKRIVEDIWPCVKEGGFLIYSTCTLNPFEDEENVKWMLEHLDGELVKIPIEDNWGMIETGFGVKCLPSKMFGEGFFISLIQKKAGETFHYHHRKPQLKTPAEFDKSCLKEELDLAFLKQGDFLLAYSQKHHNAFEILRNKLYVRKLGVTLGEIKQKDFVFAHDFSLSDIIDNNAFQQVELDLDQALNFLRKSDLSPEMIEGKRGVHLVTYNGVNLGFVKCLGNRANNMYPTDWRLRI